MKILLVQDYLRSGGTERQTLLLASAFAAAGHETVILTFRPGGKLGSGTRKRFAADPGVDSKRLRVPLHTHLQPFDLHLDWFAPGLFTAAKRLAPAIILCMGRMANCYAGGLQTELPGSVVIATMRTGKPLPWFFRRSLGLVRHIVANSGAAREALTSQHGIAAEKIAVIHNALVFPPRAEGAGRETLRARHGAGPGTAVLLCVAMFRPEKNQRELLEIAAGLPAGLDWQLWLAGEGPALSHCQALARTRGLDARVRFLGFQADAAPLYAAADLAVHASHTDSLSNFIIEAQAHGLPAVASEAQGVRECLLPGQTGWVIAPGDRDGFRKAIVTLIDEGPVVRAARGMEAATFARSAFDPGRQTAAYLELFHRLHPR